MEIELPHPHPLIFHEEGTDNGGLMFCSSCQKALNPPAFSCSACNFLLHLSCIALPSVIQTHFHPQHRELVLTKTNCDHCSCCWQKPRDCIYKCSECDFIIDLKCALANTKASGLILKGGKEYQHFSHAHPLTFLEEEQESGRQVVCHVCERLIVSGPTYFCSRCDIHLHKDCAELPREKSQPNRHDHPLFLFPPRPHHDMPEFFCASCKNRCAWFTYSCLQCNFHLHVTCESSPNHNHNFTKFRNQISFHCLLCGDMEYNHKFPWFCSDCHLLAHEECADLPPSNLQIVGHQHALDLTHSLTRVDAPHKLACEICRREINARYAAYNCSKCNYVACVKCVRRKRTKRIVPLLVSSEASDSLTTNPINLEAKNVSDIEVLHFNRKHELTLCNVEPGHDKYCAGCMQCVSTPSFGCAECDFILHKECSRLPRKKSHPLHLSELTLVLISDFVFQCNACLQYYHGFAYHCEKCRSTLDIRCSSIPTKCFKHAAHKHPLSLAQNNEDQNCCACGQSVSNKMVFKCDYGCNFSLDYRCETLTLAVRYRFDMPSLNLTFAAEDKTGEYYCHVCEEGRNPDLWFYYSEQCCFAAHPACVLGEYPWLKSGFYGTHPHPLTLVSKGKENYSPCGNCNKSCFDNLAFVCGRCKFNVHAVGHCYHAQIVQGKITFRK